jgi:hypothetical protein
MSLPARDPYLLPPNVPKVNVFAAVRKAPGKDAAATLEGKPSAEVRTMHERDYLARVTYCAGAGFVVLSALSDPASMSAYLFEHSLGGWAPILAIGMALALLLLDLIINDWAPERYRFDFAYQVRPKVYILTAFAYLIPLFAASRHEVRSLTAAGAYLHVGMAALGVTLAARAVVQRHKHRFGGTTRCDTSS